MRRRASAEQIAAWVRRQGGPVTPAELRVRYGVGDDTLRRRRDALARLGVVHVEAGRSSHYIASEPVFDPAAGPPDPATDPAIVATDPAVRSADPAADGRLAFVLNELRLQDGRTIGEASTRDPWIVDNLLRPIFQVDADGLPSHPLCYFELARGHGKSQDGGGVALTEAFLYPGTEVVVAAADVEQASIVLDHIDGFVQRSPQLAAHVERGPNMRTFPGSRVRVISSDAATAWGLGGVYPRFRLICDELVQWKAGRGEELWEALYSATGKVRDAQTLIFSNAGWDADRAWQYRIRESARLEPFAHLYAPEGVVASWIEAKWIEQQRKLLPPAAFERVIENRWVAQFGDFISAEQLDACTDSTLAPIASGSGVFFGAIDLGLVKDRTAFAILQSRNGRFELCEMQVWQGTRAKPVSIEHIERAIIDATERFPGLRLYADRWQFEHSLQRLRSRGVRIARFEFSETSVQRLSESLYRSITSRTLALYPGETELRRELLGLVVKEGPRGWRMDHRSSGYSDRAVALAMAVALAEEHTRHAPMRFAVARGRIDLPSRTTDALDPLWNAVFGKKRNGGAIGPVPGGVIAHAPAGVLGRRTPTVLGAEVTFADVAHMVGVYDGVAAARDLGLQRIEPGTKHQPKEIPTR